ncbi:MAG TPA: hypothetical protein VD884_22040 [Ohtaekwangia sp.]|nr:hypothetical protein [Ohtaekwangia sp.]
MSSHHFVKEGQEPALFIQYAISHKLIEPLLEWAPLVIVEGSVIEQVLVWGIKIDVVLTDRKEDELSPLLADQMPVRIIKFESESGIHAVLSDFLKSEGQKNVTIVSDHTTVWMEFLRDKDDLNSIVIVQEMIRWFFVKSGSLEKWLPAETQLEIAPVSNTYSLEVKGAENQGDKLIVKADSLVNIKSPQRFWVGERN